MLRAEVTLAVHLSGVEVVAGIVMPPQPQWTNFLYTFLPAFLFLLLLPKSPVHPFSSLVTVSVGRILRSNPDLGHGAPRPG